MNLNLSEKGLDAMLVSKPENIRYLTGYTGDTGLLVLTGEERYLLTDFRYVEQARQTAKGCHVVTVSGSGMAEAQELCSGQVGFEGDYLRWNQGEALKKAFPDAMNVSGWIEEVRAIKTPDELEIIKKASALAQDAFWKTLEIIHPGMTEREVAAELEYQMKRLGADKTSFATITVAGKNTSLVHGEPGDNPLQSGDFLLMDFGCVYQGYCSDMTRTVGIGRISEKQQEIYQIVKRAQQTALERIQPGMGCADADALARDVIAKAGYGAQFGHSLGHGVGLEIHEQPNLSPKSKMILRPGMAVTVEPGIYLEGEFGVRIEDLIVITEDGYENLCKDSPKELLCI